MSLRPNQLENSAMSKIDFNAMTLDEAKHYFLEHRDDQEAFYAYINKLRVSGRAIVIDPTDPASEARAITHFQERLKSRFEDVSEADQ